MGRFANQCVVVAGAAGGIGRAVSAQLARQGARLVLNDHGADLQGHGSDPGIVNALAQELRHHGAQVVTSHLRLDQSAAATHIIDAALNAFGRVDAVFSAIGASRQRGILWESADTATDDLATYVGGALRLIQAAAAPMIRQTEGGSILLCAGSEGHFPSAQRAVTAAIQAGIVALARTAAVELRSKGVRINVLVPTAKTRTNADSAMFRALQAGSLSPGHIAPVADFLLHADARDISGEVVGCAGNRLYGLRSAETPGAFAPEEHWTAAALEAAWSEVRNQNL